MPIEFNQPGAYNPAVSAAYGAAEEWNQTAPILQHQQEAINRQQEQYQNSYQQQALANQHSADLGANRAADAAQFGSQMAYRNTALDQQQAMQSQEFAHQAAMQQQGAALNSWLNQQDLSQKEVMRLQQQKNTVGDLTAAYQRGDINKQTYQDGLLQLQTGINAGDQRLKASQQRNLEAMTQQHTAEAARLTATADADMKFHALTAEQKRTPRWNEGMRSQIAADFDQNYPPAQLAQDAADAGLSPEQVQAWRQKKIDEVTEAEGGLRGHDVQQPGGKSVFDEYKPTAQAKPPAPPKPFSDAAAVKDAQAVADVMYPPTKDDKGMISRSGESLNFIATYIGQRKAEHDAAVEAAKAAASNGAGPKQDRWASIKRAGTATDTAGTQDTGATTTTGQPQDARALLEQNQERINALPLSPETRSVVNEMMDKWKAKLAEVGGYKGLSKDEQERFNTDSRYLRDLVARVPAAAKLMRRGNALGAAAGGLLAGSGPAAPLESPPADTAPPSVPPAFQYRPGPEADTKRLNINRDFPHGLKTIRERAGDLLRRMAAGSAAGDPGEH